ncbi:hypothetical protein PT300_14080 [Enterobacteriaceae bacterium ESL0689]|nr:hypothetical protein [Enterobacteriaceae bacterium ESL0689]
MIPIIRGIRLLGGFSAWLLPRTMSETRYHQQDSGVLVLSVDH